MATVKYKLAPVLNFSLQRITEAEDEDNGETTVIIEDLGLFNKLLDARRVLRALTEYARRNPEDKDTVVLDYGDVEVH